MPKFTIYDENGVKFKEENGQIYRLNKGCWVLDLEKLPPRTANKDLGFEFEKLRQYTYAKLLEFKALFQSRKNRYYKEKKYIQYHEAAIKFHTVYLEMMQRNKRLNK